MEFELRKCQTDGVKEAGNAFIYILIAVVLFAGLSFVISKSSENAPQKEITDAGIAAATASMFAYESAARSAVEQMVSAGANIDDIDFTLPSKNNFNTAPTLNKLFHPDGGGLQWRPLPKAALGDTIPSSSPPANGFYVGRFNNFEWTPTSAQDVIFTAIGVSKALCEALNLKITGSAVVPNIGNSRAILIDSSLSSTGNSDFTASKCSTCNGKPAFCTWNGSQVYTYYSILVAR